jgi:propionyl-CoA carboxylase alpha chain
MKVKFMGPPAKAIQGMGDKLESKRLAIKAGVNTVSGTRRPNK